MICWILLLPCVMKYKNSNWAVTAIPTINYKIAGKLSGYSEFVYRKAESQDYQYGLEQV